MSTCRWLAAGGRFTAVVLRVGQGGDVVDQRRQTLTHWHGHIGTEPGGDLVDDGHRCTSCRHQDGEEHEGLPGGRHLFGFEFAELLGLEAGEDQEHDADDRTRDNSPAGRLEGGLRSASDCVRDELEHGDLDQRDGDLPREGQGDDLESQVAPLGHRCCHTLTDGFGGHGQDQPQNGRDHRGVELHLLCGGCSYLHDGCRLHDVPPLVDG